MSPGKDWAPYSASWKAPPSFLLLPRHLWHQRQDQRQEERDPGDPRWVVVDQEPTVKLSCSKLFCPTFSTLAFLFFLCSCVPLLVGYSWLPLLKEGRLSSQEFSIPVSCNLPPGYLGIKEASNTKVRGRKERGGEEKGTEYRNIPNTAELHEFPRE